MIELDYFPDGVNDVVYQVLQFRTGEAWRVVCAGEMICSMEKLDGLWYVKGKNNSASYTCRKHRAFN